MTSSRREKSLRKAAREQFQAIAAKAAAAEKFLPQSPTKLQQQDDPLPPAVAPGAADSKSVRAGRSPFGLASANGGREATEQAGEGNVGMQAEGDQAAEGTPATATPLTQRVRALYEDSIVPVRAIAQLAGVSERTIYKYVQRGFWRRRHRCLAREEAEAAAGSGRSLKPAAAFAPAKGAERPFVARSAGGRFIARADAGLPFARGLKALDPAGGARAEAACARAEGLSREAVAAAEAQARERQAQASQMQARAKAERGMRTDMRALELLSGSLVELARPVAARKAPAQPRVARLQKRLERTILAAIERIGGDRRGREDEGIAGVPDAGSA